MQHISLDTADRQTKRDEADVRNEDYQARLKKSAPVVEEDSALHSP